MKFSWCESDGIIMFQLVEQEIEINEFADTQLNSSS